MRSRFLAVAGLAVAGAQGGHLVAYQLRFGGAASRLQATGAHAYFPTALKTAFGVLALAAIAALLVVGVARAVARGPRARAFAAPGYGMLLAALFTLQLTCFTGQEVAESLAAGVAPDSAANLLLWGMAGQLPVALAGAAVLAWLGPRVEAAVAELGEVVRACAPLLVTAPLAAAPVAARERAVAGIHEARSRIVKRGPPRSSTFRPI